MTEKRAMNLDPAAYARHPLHGGEAAWPEKNCYVDVWIEAVHALGFDPTPMFAPAVAVDFETDQWTFFKPSHADLEALYGIDVQELQIWRPLVEHAQLHVGEGRLVATEADSFYLPDVRGTDYRTNHVKSTIIINAIDVEAKTLGYFHNTSYYALAGDDFDGLFRLGVPHDPAFLPLYCEFARIDRAKQRPDAELVDIALRRVRAALRRRPAKNPMIRFRERFPRDVEWLQKEGLPLYHGYAFASLRQCGVSYDLAAQFFGWLAKSPRGEERATAEGAAAAFGEISESCKALVLKTARPVHAKRAVDFDPLLATMESSWARAMELACARAGVE